MKCVVCASDFRSFGPKQVACSVECRFKHYEGRSSDHEVCWEWSGPVNENGYGILCGSAGEKKKSLAHRVAYTRANGHLPDHLFVLHGCDNPRCVNPSHLRAGTAADNNADRSAKGRSGSRHYSEAEKLAYSLARRGANHALAKLTEEQARLIKYELRWLSNRAAAEMFGVKSATVSHIRSGRNWRHI